MNLPSFSPLLPLLCGEVDDKHFGKTKISRAPSENEQAGPQCRDGACVSHERGEVETVLTEAEFGVRESCPSRAALTPPFLLYQQNVVHLLLQSFPSAFHTCVYRWVDDTEENIP